MAIFLKISIYDSYMSHIYTIYMFSESEFSGECYENKIFRIRTRKILRKFWNLTSSEMRGRIFFRFQIRKERKNSHQMISIYIRFIPDSPTQHDFEIFEGLRRLRIMELLFKGLNL